MQPNINTTVCTQSVVDIGVLNNVVIGISLGAIIMNSLTQ